MFLFEDILSEITLSGKIQLWHSGFIEPYLDVGNLNKFTVFVAVSKRRGWRPSL